MVRNAARAGVNVYMMATGGTGETFLGQVGAGKSHTFHIRGTAIGDTISLRARPITGHEQDARDRIILGRNTTWQIP